VASSAQTKASGARNPSVRTRRIQGAFTRGARGSAVGQPWESIEAIAGLAYTPRMPGRRELLASILRVGLLSTLCRRDALAATARVPAQRLLRGIDDASRALAARQIGPSAWQDRVESLASEVDLDDLRRSIDFDKLAPALGQHDTSGGESLRLAGLRLSCATKVFCLRKGEAITPHGHRNMVSMHLVLSGEVRVRHFERIRDERPAPPPRDGLSPPGGFIVMRPTIDRLSRAGDATSISSARDNVHWFVAQSERAFTFDCILSDLEPLGFSYGIDLVDPDRAQRLPDATLRAPVIDWGESVRRYGKV
jgi:hypothetical protein